MATNGSLTHLGKRRQLRCAAGENPLAKSKITVAKLLTAPGDYEDGAVDVREISR
jgi:hypothetical protein